LLYLHNIAIICRPQSHCCPYLQFKQLWDDFCKECKSLFFWKSALSL